MRACTKYYCIGRNTYALKEAGDLTGYAGAVGGGFSCDKCCANLLVPVSEYINERALQSWHRRWHTEYTGER